MALSPRRALRPGVAPAAARPRRACIAGLAAVLGALALAAGCAPRAPREAPRGPTVLMSSTPGQVQPARRSGPTDAELERQVERALGVLHRGPAPDLVREVGMRVAAASPRADVAYRFAIVDREEPNAFALPTGRIYVSRGLLALLDGPDELAGVLGHEVAHVAARHAEGRSRQAVAATVLSTLSVLAAGLGAATPRDAALAGPAAQAAAAGALAAYSREQEREADALGESLAAAAGYAPGGLARALRALDHDRRLREGASPLPRFFDTHPGGAERFAAAATRRAEVDADGDEDGAARGREAFLRALDGLVVGPDPAAGVFDGSRFLHPGLDLALRFPEGWTLSNAPAAVVAVSPSRDAAISLEMAAPAPSLETRVRADLGAAAVSAFSFDALRIGEAPALRVVGLAPAGAGSGELVALDVTWVARPEGIYRITGRTSEERFRRHAGAFLAAAKSLRRITPGERASLRVLRLRVVEGDAGEELADVVRRTGTPWTPAELAIANGLAPGARLEARRLLKVARSEPWEEPAAAAPDGSATPAAPASPPGPDPR